MIVVKHASKSFGATRAVNDLSFALQPGHMTGLLGPNGAGKTTTIRMIAGYLTPDAGSITLAGHPVQATRNADPNAAKRNLGYLPESAPLYPELKPAQYLDYRAKLFGLPRKERRAAVARVLDRCRLTDMAHKRIGVLSKGYRQRVGLAAAIVHDPPVLILDEPTNGLDPAQMRSTRALIAELAEQRTVLLCTHVIPEVERACARVLVIAAGRLVADGPPDEVVTPMLAVPAETITSSQSVVRVERGSTFSIRCGQSSPLPVTPTLTSTSTGSRTSAAMSAVAATMARWRNRRTGGSRSRGRGAGLTAWLGCIGCVLCPAHAVMASSERRSRWLAPPSLRVDAVTRSALRTVIQTNPVDHFRGSLALLGDIRQWQRVGLDRAEGLYDVRGFDARLHRIFEHLFGIDLLCLFAGQEFHQPDGGFLVGRMPGQCHKMIVRD